MSTSTSTAIVTATCYGCGRPFTFIPARVASIRMRGGKQPICQQCVDGINRERIKRGFEPIKPSPGAGEPGEERRNGER